MSQLKTLTKGYLIYFIGNSASRFIGVLLLPLFTRVLTKSDYGYFEIVQSAILLLTPMVSMQVFEGILRFLIGKENPDDQREILSSSTAIVLISLAAANLVYFGIAKFTSFPYTWLILGYFNSFFLSSYGMRIARAFNKRAVYSISNFVYGAGIALFSVIFLLTDKLDLANILTAYIAANIINLIYLGIALNLSPLFSLTKINRKLVQQILGYSFPLLFDAVCWWFMNLSDRFLLKYFMNLEAVGIYGVAYKFSAALLFINLIFYMVWQEESIKNSGKENLAKGNADVFNHFIKMQIGAFLAIIPLTKFYIVLFVDPSYHSAINYVPLLVGGAVFSSFSAFFGMRYQVEKRTNIALVTSIIGSTTNFALNIFLIPAYGIWGAAASTIFSFAVLWIIRIINADSFIKVSLINWKLLSGGIIAAIFYSILLFYADFAILGLMLGMALIVFFVLNREVVLQFSTKFGRSK